MMEKRRRFWRIGAALTLGLFLVLMVLAPFGASVAGDGGPGTGIPIAPPDTTPQNSVTPDTTTSSSGGTVIVSPWLIWLF